MATPQATPEPLLRFCDSLRELKLASGTPSLGDLSRRMPGRPSVSTLSQLLAGKIRRAPRWELVRDLVDACREHAQANGITLPHDLSSSETWRRRHGDLVRALDSAAAQRSPDNLARLLRLAPDNRLLHLGDLTDSDLGVSEPIPGAGAGYIARADFDEEMRSMLSLGGPPYPYVIAYGEEGAGKTRSAVAALRNEFPSETTVLIPRGGAAVSELRSLVDSLNQSGRPAVVWLDDLTAADLEHLTLDLLEWLSGWAVTVGTIPALRCGEILGGTRSEARAVAQAALRRACLVYLPLELNDAERAEAAWHFEGGAVPQNFARVADAPEPREMLLRLNTARSTNPIGFALVHAAINCHRAGLVRGVTRDELRRLLPPHLTLLSTSPATDAEIEWGLSWAQAPAVGGRALLQPLGLTDGEARWKAAQELVGEADSGPVPDSLWLEVIGMATPQECLMIGHQAANRDVPGYSAVAFTKASEHEEHRLDALLGLGLAQTMLGSFAAAKASYQRVVESGETAKKARAAYMLGGVLEAEGDTAGAEDAWRMAAETGHEHYAPMAQAMLALMLIGLGDYTEAESLFLTVADSGHGDAAPRAWALLGTLREQLGDLKGALTSWERAAKWNHPDVMPMLEDSVAELRTRMAELAAVQSSGPGENAEVLLERGERLRKLGHETEALAAFRDAAASENPDERARALFGVAMTLMGAKRTAEACETLEAVAECGVPRWEAEALLELGSTLYEKEDWNGARRAWSRVVETSVTGEVERASVNLGLLELRVGHHDAAAAAFRRAAEAHDPNIRAQAAMNLALLGIDEGMADDAVDAWYRIAIETEDPEFLPQAAFALGGRLVARGHTAEPKRLFEKAIESGDPESEAHGTLLLGMLQEASGDVENAAAAYSRVIACGHANHSVHAHARLGRLCVDNGRMDAARYHLQRAVDAGHPDHSPHAGFLLGLVHCVNGEFDKAELVFQQVIETGNPDAARPAAYRLVYLRRGGGRTEEARHVWESLIEQGREPNVD
ncbi:tetratricopeptide repeat protein [Streptomyces sp. NBC_00623]|uniref:tetratricopeptide repeat protein n=1 Tax=Streptomyces sp. NBC_00623 TaxID=2975790 RepID=UPI0030E54D24